MLKFFKNPLTSIFITVLIDLISFGIIIPILPGILIEKHGYIIFGLLIALFPFGQFLSTPIWGELSDKFGRRNLLLLSIFSTFLSYIIFIYGIMSENISLLLIGRFVSGLMGGNISIAQAAIADTSKDEDKTKNFGLIGAAFGLGVIIGPYLGGVFSNPSLHPSFDILTPFYLSLTLSLLNTLFVYFFFKETLKSRIDSGKIDYLASLKHIYKSFTYKPLKHIFFTNFFFQSGFAFFATFFSVFLISKFSFKESEVGNFYALIGVSVVLTQIFITKPLSKKFPPEKILKYSLLFSALIMPLYLVPSMWQGLIPLVILFAVANGLSQAGTIALLSQKSESSHQGEVMGINSSLQALGQAVPPLVSGFASSYFSPSTPILIAGFIGFVSWFIFIYFVNKKK